MNGWANAWLGVQRFDGSIVKIRSSKSFSCVIFFTISGGRVWFPMSSLERSREGLIVVIGTIFSCKKHFLINDSTSVVETFQQNNLTKGSQNVRTNRSCEAEYFSLQKSVIPSTSVIIRFGRTINWICIILNCEFGNISDYGGVMYYEKNLFEKLKIIFLSFDKT